MEKDYSLYKYYKGETELPFDEKTEKTKCTFWLMERQHFETCLHSKEFHNGFVERLKDYLKNTPNLDENLLTDERISIEKRALVYYLDLMIGKWMPYDGDLIFDY